MTLRILELHRVLKTTGSFYLHCDPTMSHYLKTVCDIIFEVKNFKNEIIWERTLGSGSSKYLSQKFPANTDVLLFYTRSSKYNFNLPSRPLSEGALKRYDKVDKDGRRFFWADLRTYSKDRLEELLKRGEAKISPNAKNPRYKKYLDKSKGTPISNLWYDIHLISTSSPERLGYPTQKPKALLERIIQASSNEGDIVLDAFCGCGTTIDAAESLHRNWIGIDISPIAISLIKRRLKDTYLEGLSRFEVRGTPIDEQSAIELWKQNPFAFQDWWLTEFEVFSTTFGTKGADKGIDGLAQYLTTPHSPPFTKGGKQKGGSTFAGEEGVIRAAFQVKGGQHIQSKDIDALLGAMEKHKCELGVFLTIAEPTKPMLDTVAGSGFVEVPGHKYPKLQILTLNDYFGKKRLKLPSVNITFKAAQLKGKKSQGQYKLEM
jgi:DNA modification methylase